jgi:hypothetical protein
MVDIRYNKNGVNHISDIGRTSPYGEREAVICFAEDDKFDGEVLQL